MTVRPIDPEAQIWLDGYDKQRAEWDRQYNEATARYEQHMKQVRKAAKTATGAAPVLASEEQLAALRRRLSGTQTPDEQLEELRKRLSGN